LFTHDKNEPFAEYRLSPIGDTRPILKQLLQIYWQGLHQCIYFFPQSSHAFGEVVCLKGGEARSGLNKAASKWIRDYGYLPGEGEDPYNKVMLGSKNPLRTERFQQVSKQFWAPFFEVLNQEAG
jgi:exodeoxyribonuclease V gamma subunit